jgi:hypothetical protein
VGLGVFRNSKVWHCIARLLCVLRVRLSLVSCGLYLGDVAGSERSAFCRQSVDTYARGIDMLSLSVSLWFVGISAVVHLMGTILPALQSL